MKAKKASTNKSLDLLTKKYLKENPDLKKTLELFSLTNEEYNNALASLNKQNIIISTRSTTANHVNLARN